MRKVAIGLAVVLGVSSAFAQDKCVQESKAVEHSLELRDLKPDGGCVLRGCASAGGAPECSEVRNHPLCRNAQARELSLKLGKRGLGVGDGGL